MSKAQTLLKACGMEPVEVTKEAIHFTPGVHGSRYKNLTVSTRLRAGEKLSYVTQSNGTPEGDAELIEFCKELIANGYKVTYDIEDK
jgi:hypothetical protein